MTFDGHKETKTRHTLGELDPAAKCDYLGKMGKKIKDERKKKYATAKAFAEAMGVNPSTYGNIESGQYDIPGQTLKWLAENLKVSTDYLLGVSSTPVVDLGIYATMEKYGLSQESLHTLSILAKKADDTQTTGDTERYSRGPLMVINELLHNIHTCRRIFMLLYDIIFRSNDNFRRREVVTFEDICRLLRIDKFTFSAHTQNLSDVLKLHDYLEGFVSTANPKKRKEATTQKERGAE